MKTNWQVIVKTDHTFGQVCSQTCGGFCCTYKDILKYTRFFSNLATLQMTVDEYFYYKENGYLQPDIRYQQDQYYISDDIRFTTVSTKCTYGGFCGRPKSRPFLCKLFPFYPVVDERGNIDHYTKGKIWQEFLLDKTPCTYQVDNNNLVPGIHEMVTEFFKESKNIFYFKSMDILTEALKERIEEIKAENNGHSSGELIRQVEGLYLKNNLLDFDKVRRSIHQLFVRMKQIWGDDLVLDVLPSDAL